jgi:hypothetical protein
MRLIQKITHSTSNNAQAKHCSPQIPTCLIVEEIIEPDRTDLAKTSDQLFSSDSARLGNDEQGSSDGHAAAAAAATDAEEQGGDRGRHVVIWKKSSREIFASIIEILSEIKLFC